MHGSNTAVKEFATIVHSKRNFFCHSTLWSTTSALYTTK